MTNLTEIKAKLPEALILEFLNSNDDCTIDLVMLVELGVYPRKDHAVRALKRNFLPEEDFSSIAGNASQQGTTADIYLLTSDCFKQLCMLAETETGKLVRRYYLEVEKRWKNNLRQKEEPSDLTIECWIQEIVVDIVSSLFVEVANNISNVESITIQQKKQLRAEFQKGISREQLHAKAQKALGKIGHNAAHQYSSIIEVAAERAAPYLDIILDRVQKALQCKSSPLVLPPASKPVVIKEYIRIGVPKTEATFIEQMEGIHEDLSSGNWKSYGKNWIEYSQKRWNVSKTHGYRLRDAANIYARFKTAGVKPLPTNEHQIRELPRLSKEQQIEVWLKAVEIEGAEPSPAIVETLVEKYE